MTQPTTDKAVLDQIGTLVDEEKKLWAKGGLSEEDQSRLAKISVDLDRCWDLLRQRRGLREFGRNPDEAEERPAKVVENYKG